MRLCCFLMMTLTLFLWGNSPAHTQDAPTEVDPASDPSTLNPLTTIEDLLHSKFPMDRANALLAILKDPVRAQAQRSRILEQLKDKSLVFFPQSMWKDRRYYPAMDYEYRSEAVGMVAARVLASLNPDRAEIETLVLTAEDGDSLDHTAWVLGEIQRVAPRSTDSKVVDKLVAHLTHSKRDREVSVEGALYALGAIRDARTLPPILEFIEDELLQEPVTALHLAPAVQAAGSIADNRAGPVLVRILGDASKIVAGDSQYGFDLVDATVQAITKLPSPQSGAALIRFIDQFEDLVTIQAGEDHSLSSIHDEHSDALRFAIRRIGEIHPEGSASNLTEYLKDRRVRGTAARALIQIDDASVFDSLFLVLLAQGCLSPSTAPDAYRSPSGLGGLSSAVSCLKDVPYDPIHERSTHEFKVRSPGQPSIDLPAPAVPSAEILDPFDPK